MNSSVNLSSQQLRHAAQIKEKIQSLETELVRVLGSSTKSVAHGMPEKRRKMSASARAKISAAAKARWSKVKGKSSAPKTKSKMSPAARKKLSAMAKARWAKIKAAGRKKL
jgi:nucleoid-associated protein YgaU